ncbi:MAG: type II toxin-antitoxin system RelE/ParE family toxin [Spirochaetes bacterium]|nr:type II toxin-antitoxin system RelE/ParE family toxin [Spirochaetota bacterium]
MIISIKDKTTQDIFDSTISRHSRKLPLNLHSKAQQLLDILNAVNTLNDLGSIPGNKLELLKGRLKGFYSIRINNKWRIIFTWKDNNAVDVQIIDYH